MSTTRGGGAGLAALRLIAAQRDAGIDAQLLTQADGRLLREVAVKRIPSRLRMAQKLITIANKSVTKDHQFFFSPFNARILSEDELLEGRPDVIHIHNWYNFVSWEILRNLGASGQLIVATAHDERLLTGGCHLTQGCASFVDNCSKCPQARLPGLAGRPALRLRAQLAESGSRIVAPSRWLAERLRSNLPLPAADVHHIPNCLDPRTFHPTNGTRSGVPVLGVMTGKAVTLATASLARLEQLIKDGLSPAPIIHFAGVGSRPRWSGDSVDFGVLTTEEQRADYWRSCDVALAATLGDNFPNVNLEAVFSGVMVVTCRVGGAAETIEQTGRGIAVPGNPRDLAEALALTLRRVPEYRETTWRAWELAKEFYGGETVAGRYIDVYGSAS